MSFLGVEFELSGPLFDGSAVDAIKNYVDDLPLEVAKAGLDDWLTIYRSQVQHPTPYYEYFVRAERQGTAAAHLWDGGEVVYGPWLEGTGSRNSPHTRFPGYHSMEKTAALLNAGEAQAVADRLFAERYESRVN